jgi:arylformamidase
MNVYLNYSQEELNYQYDQRSLVADTSPYISTWSKATQYAKSTFVCRENIAYGDHRDEILDLYLPDRVEGDEELAPLLVFCHGGAWQRLTKDESGHMAAAYVPERVALAALNFSLAPEKDLSLIVGQVRRAVLYLYEHASELMVHPKKFFVCGHSSGAHLAANVAVTNWPAMGAPHDMIKGVTLVSGPYDLEPVRLSARNDYLFLDESTARALTPQTHLRPGLPPAIFSWGGRELDEFQRQSASLAEAWENKGMAVQRLFFKDKNHFEMGCEHMNLDSPLAKATLIQIKGG